MTRLQEFITRQRIATYFCELTGRTLTVLVSETDHQRLRRFMEMI